MLVVGPLIGEGTFARVFSAERRLGGVGQSVAVRVPKQPGLEAAWQAEAQLLARIDHVGVVRLVDYLEDWQGRPAQILERLDGPSLLALRRPATELLPPLPLAAIVRIGSRLSEALHAIHEARGEDGRPLGAVHRDVSPDNILFDSHGEPRLIDLGTARVQAHRSTTGLMRVEGKSTFMSPERKLGQPVDRRADIYALGATLAFLAAPDPEVWSEGLPEILAPLLRRCCASEPRRRPEDALEVAEGLQEIAAPLSLRAWCRALPERRKPESRPAAAGLAEMFELEISHGGLPPEHTEHVADEDLEAVETGPTTLPSVGDLTWVQPGPVSSGGGGTGLMAVEPTSPGMLNAVEARPLSKGLVAMAELGQAGAGSLTLARLGSEWLLLKRLDPRVSLQSPLAQAFIREIESLRASPHPLLARPEEAGFDAERRVAATFSHRLDSRSFAAVIEGIEAEAPVDRGAFLLALGSIWAEGLAAWRDRAGEAPPLPVDPAHAAVGMDGRAWLFGPASITAAELALRRGAPEPAGLRLRKLLQRLFADLGGALGSELSGLLEPRGGLELEPLGQRLRERLGQSRRSVLAELMARRFG